MSDDPALNLHVVRNIGSDKTHVMQVTRPTREQIFGANYQRPSDGKAACGVRIFDGVVMRPGTKTRCAACKHVTGLTEEPAPTHPQSKPEAATTTEESP